MSDVTSDNVSNASSSSDAPVLIIGGGLAGLACARTLEGAGRACTLFEAGSEVGGRVKTDAVGGYLLDHGFQIYLDSYPQGQHFFSHEGLALRTFEPGAMVKMHGHAKPQRLVDPFRRPGSLVATALSAAAGVGDKWKVAQLRRHVAGKSLDELLAVKQQSTLEFLREFGFSDRVIDNFFRPFYGGITLDRELTVSSRFFLWSFKLFGSGNACLPSAGMAALPRQISSRLRKTEIRTKTEIRRVDGSAVITAGGQRVQGSAVVVAAEAPAAAELLRMSGYDPDPAVPVARKQTATLYFTADESPFADKLILLAAEGVAAPINSVAVLTNVAPSYAPAGKTLMSVSVVDADAFGDDLEDKVQSALPQLVGELAGLEQLKTYRIDYALPDQAPPALDPPHADPWLDDHVLLAGDYCDTASINGALQSGRRAAEAVLNRKA